MPPEADPPAGAGVLLGSVAPCADPPAGPGVLLRSASPAGLVIYDEPDGSVLPLGFQAAAVVLARTVAPPATEAFLGSADPSWPAVLLASAVPLGS